MTTRREFLRHTAITSIAAYAPFARAGIAPASPPVPLTIDRALAAGGFFDDPYSGFATWYVNGSTGVNAPNPGVDRRPPGHIYKSYENALRDVFYVGNPGARRIVVQAGTYAPASTSIGGYFPCGGPDAAHPCVIMGDPALASPPIIDGHGGSTNAFCIGSVGGYGTGAATVNNIVIRKLEIRNFTADSIYFYWGPSDNVTIEYCNIHGNRYPKTNPSSTGGIAVTTANCTKNVTIRYCKFSDFQVLGGGYGFNCSPIETYGSDNVAIHNCLFVGNKSAIFLKLLDPSGTANGWTVSNNIFANNYNAIMQGTNGNGFQPQSNWAITGNLFYGPALDVGGGRSAIALASITSAIYTYSQGSGILIANNTIAEDCDADWGWFGSSGIVVRDNVCLSSARHGWSTDPADSFYAAHGGLVNADSFTQIDYNVYAGAKTWALGFGAQSYAYKYVYNSFSAWQNAVSKPISAGVPPDLNGRDPDKHGLWIPNLTAPFNTIENVFRGHAARDYTISSGSPLLTASSSGGRVGHDPMNIGPGW
jgi:hypothetical protein